MREEPIQFGEGGRLFGILTLPERPSSGSQPHPVFILLNAGLLHRVGPSRLGVRIARELAQLGIATFRFDLAGKGDSPRRPGLTNQQSVAADYAEVTTMLDARLGRASRVLAGLCSGADNVIRLTIDDPAVVGMVLLDPISFEDRGFRARQLINKYLSPARYASWVRRRARRHGAGQPVSNIPSDALALRDLPSQPQVRQAFEAIRDRKGRVLSIFSGYAVAVDYYNGEGQLGRALGMEGYGDFCAEHLWPDVDHTYQIAPQRDRLLGEVKTLAQRMVDQKPVGGS